MYFIMHVPMQGLILLCMLLLFATFAKNIETHIKSNSMTKALKQRIRWQVYYL